MKFKFLELTAFLFPETALHHQRRKVVTRVSNFLAMLEIAINEKQVVSIKSQYDEWALSIKTDDDKTNNIVQKYQEAIDFAHGLICSPETLIRTYEEKLKQNPKEVGLLNFHLGCAQIFLALKTPQDKEHLLIESQKSFNIANTSNWIDKADLNFWYALNSHMKKDTLGTDFYLKKFFTQSKNINDLLIDDNYLCWLKEKLPNSFLNYSKKMYLSLTSDKNSDQVQKTHPV